MINDQDFINSLYGNIDRRSPEYMMGYLAMVESVILLKQFDYPYPAGSAQADAFLFGMEMARKVLEKKTQDSSHES